MSTEEIHHTLSELQMELDKAHFEHEGQRDKLNQSLIALEEKLREESYMSGDEFLVHEIKEAVTHFEESHPQITDLVGRLSDLLAKMGL